MSTSRSHAHQLKGAIEAIEAKVQLQCIQRGINALESGIETIKEGGVEIQRPLDKTRVVALSKALEFRFKLLAKVFPDRKALEVDLGEQTLGVIREYSPVERAARLAYLLERLREGGVGPAAQGRDAHMDTAPGSTVGRPKFLS